jgi:uncharacterized protein YgiM (DUF1202 family)
VKTKIKLILLICLLFNTGCGIKTARDVTPTPTRIFVTATFLPTFTPIPSETPIPNPPTPTTVPVEGTASTQINVRAQPSTAGQVLGIVAANATVQIIGKDPGGNWWQILYPASPDGIGWVTAQYVTVAGTPNVPVIGGGGANQNSGNVAILQQQLNIRSGPGTDFNSLGTLNPQDVVNLIGKDANGAWLQIEFAAGPEGKGWINAAFVQAQGVENLPIITEAGQVVGTGTPTGIPPTPTATVIPAPADGDSAENPAAKMIFSATGTKSFQYSGDISSPEGDAEDWVQFTPYTQFVRVSFECSESSLANLEVLQDGAIVQSLACGDSKAIQTLTEKVYVIHISLPAHAELQYSGYSLQVSAVP